MLKYAYNNPKQVVLAAKNGIVDGAKAFVTANPVQQGRVIGRIGGEIGLVFVGTKGIDKLGKVAKGSQIVARLSQTAKVARANPVTGLRINLELFGAKGMSNAVNPYEVGIFKDLKARSVVGDELAIHHAAQKHPAA